MTRVATVLVSYNTRELTLRALASLPDPGPLPGGGELEVLVVDNASGDGSPEAIRAAHPGVTLLEAGGNLGFGRANNLAMGRSPADVFLLLNSDAFLRDPRDLQRLVDLLLAHPRRGVLGPRILSEDGSLQYSARSFPSIPGELIRKLFLYRLPFPGFRPGLASRLLGEFFSHQEERDVDWVVGACMLVRREVWEETGGFDPDIFMYGEEQEWCARIRQRGWAIHFSPEVEIIHRRAASSGPQGAGWRTRSALEGDLAVLRTLRGPGYALAFAWVRWAATLLHAGATSLLAAVTDDPEWIGRRDEARLVTREQWSLLRGHPSPERGST